MRHAAGYLGQSSPRLLPSHGAALWRTPLSALSPRNRSGARGGSAELSPLSFAVTKLQVSKSKRTLSLVENRPIQLSCSVRSQTSQNSHFAVLWYVHKPSDADGKLILKTTHSSAFEYGTYAEEEGLRARLQFERHVSGGLFSLTVQRAEVSDSGSYYCHVEEWLLSPNYAWYKLAEEVSGRTEVTVKQPGEDRGSQPSPASGLGPRTTPGWQGSAGSTGQRRLVYCGLPSALADGAFPGGGLRGSRGWPDEALLRVSGVHPGSGPGPALYPAPCLQGLSWFPSCLRRFSTACPQPREERFLPPSRITPRGLLQPVGATLFLLQGGRTRHLCRPQFHSGAALVVDSHPPSPALP